MKFLVEGMRLLLVLASAVAAGAAATKPNPYAWKQTQGPFGPGVANTEFARSLAITRAWGGMDTEDE